MDLDSIPPDNDSAEGTSLRGYFKKAQIAAKGWGDSPAGFNVKTLIVLAIVILPAFGVFGLLVLNDRMKYWATLPPYLLSAGHITQRIDEAPPNSTQNQVTIVATFKSAEFAESAWQAAVSRMTTSAALFGDSIVLELPSNDKLTRDHWLTLFRSQASQCIISLPDFGPRLNLHCSASSPDAAESIDRQLDSGESDPPMRKQFSMADGNCYISGNDIIFDNCLFLHPAQGAPGLVAWLNARGCTEFRYQFVPFIPERAPARQ